MVDKCCVISGRYALQGLIKWYFLSVQKAYFENLYLERCPYWSVYIVEKLKKIKIIFLCLDFKKEKGVGMAGIMMSLGWGKVAGYSIISRVQFVFLFQYARFKKVKL